MFHAVSLLLCILLATPLTRHDIAFPVFATHAAHTMRLESRKTQLPSTCPGMISRHRPVPKDNGEYSNTRTSKGLRLSAWHICDDGRLSCEVSLPERPQAEACPVFVAGLMSSPLLERHL